MTHTPKPEPIENQTAKAVDPATLLLGELTWDKCHGRRAKTIWFPATPDQQMQVNNVECELICVSEYKGDRDEMWICEVRDGVELARHNTRSIESIIWEKPNAAGQAAPVKKPQN